MKHTLKITIILLSIFLVTQIFGLYVAGSYLGDNNTEKLLPLGLERPTMDQNLSFLFIIAGVIFGTIILLILMKFKRNKTWKMWYLFAIVLSMTITLGTFINEYIALVIALSLALIKIYKTSTIMHNFTEILVYAGIASLFIPILNVFSAIMLLLIISIYDCYAVWKSKHMIKLAKFQTDSGLFAGLNIPYDSEEKSKSNTSEKINENINSQIKTKPSFNIVIDVKDDGNEKSQIPTSNKTKREIKTEDEPELKSRNAILGGGDIAFPLLFTGAIMYSLIFAGITKSNAFWLSMIVTLFATISLAVLLIQSKKGKFYPAMPFITSGCLVGYAVMLAVIMI